MSMTVARTWCQPPPASGTSVPPHSAHTFAPALAHGQHSALGNNRTSAGQTACLLTWGERIKRFGLKNCSIPGPGNFSLSALTNHTHSRSDHYSRYSQQLASHEKNSMHFNVLRGISVFYFAFSPQSWLPSLQNILLILVKNKKLKYFSLFPQYATWFLSIYNSEKSV